MLVKIKKLKHTTKRIIVSKELVESGEILFDDNFEAVVEQEVADVICTLPGYEIVEKQLAESTPGKEHLERKIEETETKTVSEESTAEQEEAPAEQEEPVSVEPTPAPEAEKEAEKEEAPVEKPAPKKKSKKK